MKRKSGFHFNKYISGLNPNIKLPDSVEIINPYLQKEVKTVLQKFCTKFYTGRGKRVLVLGINPGRLGAGVTGIPFTDPVALEEYCGIVNPFEKKRELSSKFIYDVIESYSGVNDFYSNFLVSAVSPLGFLKDNLNYNYYDSSTLLKNTSPFIRESLLFHSKLNVSSKVVISLGEKNAAHLDKFNNELQLFDTILTTKHPRYIMQYKLKSKSAYIRSFINTFETALRMA